MPLVLINPLVFMWTKMESLCWTADRSICSMTATRMKKLTIMRSMQTILAVTTEHTHTFGLHRTADKAFTSFKERYFRTDRDRTTQKIASGVRNCMGVGGTDDYFWALRRKEHGRPPQPFSKLSGAKNTASQVKTFPHLFVSFPGALIIQLAEC